MSTTGTTTTPITNDEGLTAMYQSYREGAATYAIPLAAGSYTLKLRFMDPTTPPPPPGAPGAPTGVTAVAGNAQSTVSWTAPASNGGATITSYTVTATPGGATQTVNGTTLTAVMTGETNGTTYTFTVTATNSAGTSSASSPSTGVTPSGNTGGLIVASLSGAETATPAWSPSTAMTSVTPTTAQAHTGTHSWAATSAGGALNSTMFTPSHFAVLPNHTYTVVLWVRSNTSAARHGAAFVQWYDSGGAVTGTQVFSSEVAATSTGWTQITFTATSPAAAASADLLPFFGTQDGSNIPAGEMFFFDDISVN